MKIVVLAFFVFVIGAIVDLTQGSCPQNWEVIGQDITTVDPVCFQNITKFDVFVLSSDACSFMTPNQFSQIPATSCAGIQVLCLEKLNNSIFEVISESQINSIPVETFAVISTQQVSSLNAESCNGITNLQLSSIKTSCSGFTSQCISYITNAAALGFTPNCVTSLPSNVFSSMNFFSQIPPESVGFMNQEQIENLRASSCSEMTQQQLNALSSCSGSCDGCAGFTPNCTALLGLHNPFVGSSILAPCLTIIPPTSLSSLAVATFAEISPGALLTQDFLTPLQVAALTPEQCSMLSAVQLQGFVEGSSCAGFTAACLAEIGLHNPYVGSGLTSDCLLYLSPTAFSALPSYVLSYVAPEPLSTRDFLTLEQVSALTVSQCKALTQIHLQGLWEGSSCAGFQPNCTKWIGLENPYVGQGFTSNCLAQMAPAAFAALSPATFARIAPDSLSTGDFLTPSLVAALTVEQCQTLTEIQLRGFWVGTNCASFTPNCTQWIGLYDPYVARGILPNCLQSMTLTATAALPSYAMVHIAPDPFYEFQEFLSSDQISHLTIDQCRFFTFAQWQAVEQSCNGFTPECVAAAARVNFMFVSWLCVNLMQNETIQAITPEQMEWLNLGVARGFSSASLSWIHPDTCGAFSMEQVAVFGTMMWNTNACSGITKDCLRNISVSSISGLLPNCSQHLSPSAITGISSVQFSQLTIESVLSWNQSQFSSIEASSCGGFTSSLVSSLGFSSYEVCQVLSKECAGFLTGDVIPFFQSNCVPLLSIDVISVLGKNGFLEKMSVSALQSLKNDQLAALANLNLLPCSVVGQLTKNQLQFMSLGNQCGLSDATLPLWTVIVAAIGGVVVGAVLVAIGLVIYFRKKKDHEYRSLNDT